jgi:hypothetical protein
MILGSAELPRGAFLEQRQKRSRNFAQDIYTLMRCLDMVRTPLDVIRAIDTPLVRHEIPVVYCVVANTVLPLL